MFLAPPSWAELVRRLTGRGTEPPEVLARLLAAAQQELAAAQEFDITLVNTSVQDVCQQLIKLMVSAPYLHKATVRRASRPGGARPEGNGRQNVAGTQIADGIINPPIDELLEVVDSKYRLVIMAAKRARQINAYYSQLGEGLLEYVGPLVETRSQEKPLSISLREIKERLLSVEILEPKKQTSMPARVVLGVGAGIAAYKACELLRLLTESGYSVRVVPTPDSLGSSARRPGPRCPASRSPPTCGPASPRCRTSGSASRPTWSWWRPPPPT